MINEEFKGVKVREPFSDEEWQDFCLRFSAHKIEPQLTKSDYIKLYSATAVLAIVAVELVDFISNLFF